MTRGKKQLLIGSIFVVIILLLVWGGYRLFHTPATCFDKIQNQNEQGMDCGGVCANQCRPAVKPLQIKSSNQFLVANDGKTFDYDALFRLLNTNASYGSARIDYVVSVLDANGVSLAERTGNTYIMPNQGIFVYEPVIRTQQSATQASLKITGVQWQFTADGVWQPEVKLTTQNQGFQPDNQPGVFGKVQGSVYNASEFTLDRVDLIVVAYKAGQPIAANRTDVRTLAANGSSFFQVSWFSPLSDLPDNVVVQAETNILENTNFIKQYVPSQKFQEFY